LRKPIAPGTKAADPINGSAATFARPNWRENPPSTKEDAERISSGTVPKNIAVHSTGKRLATAVEAAAMIHFFQVMDRETTDSDGEDISEKSEKIGGFGRIGVRVDFSNRTFLKNLTFSIGMTDSERSPT
jgi:hypothetical protein